MKTTIEATQEKLRLGLNKAADIITSTMGASGSTVIVTQSNGHLLITKDGVSVAKSIQLPDPFENIGAQLLISAAKETVKTCGDGTTLTSLLLQKMVNACQTTEDYKALAKETALLKDYIQSQSKEITTTQELYNIAKTSANDTFTATLIKDIYDQTGFQTHIELEMPDDEKETSITVDKGFKLDTGFDDNWQMTDTFKQEARYDDPTFYITEEPIHHTSKSIKDLVKLAMIEKAPLVFVAEKYSREFKSFIQAQVMQANAQILLLRMSDFYGEDRTHQYTNLKAYLTDQSTAKSILSNPYYTLIYNDDHANLEPRLAELKALQENVVDPLEARNMKKRYHQLAGNIATIWVGGNTREEQKELYDRVEDAVGATSTAIENGFVPGMGSVFITFTRKDFGSKKEGMFKPKLISIWFAPMDKIISNSGIKHPSHAMSGYGGWDLITGEPINLLEKGIVDPTNTLLTALDNALANTKLVLNTKYILHNEL